MESPKQKIEAKKSRLTRLVLCDQISRSHANELLKDYAQFISRYFGCGMQLFDNIPATGMLILIVAAWASML